MSVFPDERLLELHFAECHDPIVAIRKERGEKTFACFVPTCIRMFETPAKRRMHLIDVHHYPKEYFFAVTNKGIGGLLEKWGDGVSLLRPEWKPRPDQKETKGVEDQGGIEAGPSTPRGPITPPNDLLSHEATERGHVSSLGLQFSADDNGSAAQAASPSNPADPMTQPSQPLGWTFGTNIPASARFMPRQATKPPLNGKLPGPAASQSATNEISQDESRRPPAAKEGDADMDELATAMSSVSLVPRTIRFGRGGARAGFQRPPGRKKPTREMSAGSAAMVLDPEC